ncbi:YibE/F family protein [Fructilactobacillus myrtifloralis]|uniref:YibE/F family protein n=1 Tax=Fructilactobacillus myrtifloralis TaxID=2940301 RepID=A0ABY5BPY5_9LACO|nr:YibE/F family protein [Fructilactobacillus myrtifloralis]USS84656.1 YibE/F family protein [Fructilactobacillus myrtifloralis]
MSTISALVLVLLGAMLLAGGKQGLVSFLGLLFNFAVVFLSVVLISWGIPYLIVTLCNAVIILVVSIYFGNQQGRNADIAFLTSIIVVGLVILLIIPIEHWAQVQGFGVENTEDLEGLSLQLGVRFLDVSCAMTILSCLGAVAEAAVAVATGLVELEDHDATISDQQLIRTGMRVGQEIVGTAFNTLFFGFYGELLGLFIWFARLHYTLGMIINDKIFVAELIMTIISAIGVILTIPVTIGVVLYRKRHQVKD